MLSADDWPSFYREEQHDDQLLHELLRCVKALATSDVGCIAIRSCTPNPFFPLVSLLFTDKKPGDVPTRQLMVEIVTLLFNLYPTRPAPPRWPGDDQPAGREYVFPLPREFSSLPLLARQLLLGEDKDKDLVDFVTAARRPRVYKTYLTEISDVWCVAHGCCSTPCPALIVARLACAAATTSGCSATEMASGSSNRPTPT